MAKVLVVDHDIQTFSELQGLASACGISTDHALTLKDGIDKNCAHEFDIVLLKDKLPDGAACDVITTMLEGGVSSPELIVYTQQGDPDEAEHIIRSGAWDYIVNPASPKYLLKLLERAINYRQEKIRKNETKAASLPTDLQQSGIIGSSQLLQQCLNQVAKAAHVEANVLISGESGTGKELFASAIHNISSRAGRHFVVVDCAALPNLLVESILFGHEKGAFTGADKNKTGLIKQADGGTLFLDEIGELPLEIQKKFLRVLQERIFRPVGSHTELRSDFRLIAATNRDLQQLCDDGDFREDLLYRLRTFHIELPPLRSRPADITELAYYFRDRYVQQHDVGEKRFSPDFLMFLRQYDWPGNVRELFHALERSIASAQDTDVLLPLHLPTAIRVEVTRKALKSNEKTDEIEVGDISMPEEDFGDTFPLLQTVRDEAIENTERNYLRKLMNHTKGDINKSCEIAGLSRSRLYGLLKKYHINPKGFPT